MTFIRDYSNLLAFRSLKVRERVRVRERDRDIDIGIDRERQRESDDFKGMSQVLMKIEASGTIFIDSLKSIGRIKFRLFSHHLVEADATSMGGKVSQEYHYLSAIGESKLRTCRSCNHSIDKTDVQDNGNECASCKSQDIQHNNGIEVSRVWHFSILL